MTDRSSWIEDAACAKSPLRFQNAWDYESVKLRPAAVAVCDACPVREACYDDAAKDYNSDGVRAGLVFRIRSEQAFNADPKANIPTYQEVSRL